MRRRKVSGAAVIIDGFTLGANDQSFELPPYQAFATATGYKLGEDRLEAN